MTSVRRALKLAAVTATLLGASVLGVPAASAASASTPTLSLFSGGCQSGLVGLQISGSIAASFGTIRSVSVDIWGADTFSDDHLFGPFVDVSAPLGSSYVAHLCLPASTLNEDVGEDEIFAIVRVSTGTSGFVLRTNELDHSF